MTPAILLYLLMMLIYALRQHMMHHKPRHQGIEIMLKCAATTMAAVTALLGCLKAGSAAEWVVFAGLVIGVVADGVLCVHFVRGGVLFALGHLLYIVAFCMMKRPTYLSALLFCGLMSLAAWGLLRWRQSVGRRLPLFLAYATVLSLMVAFAAPQSPVYLCGAILFAVSDGILCYLMMRRKNRILQQLSLPTYYTGQFLLGLAVYITAL